MSDTSSETDSIVWISVPLDERTAERLRALSDDCHAQPEAIAASLLHDVLEDDEAAEVPGASLRRPPTIN